MTMPIYESAEDYLEAILRIQEEKGVTDIKLQKKGDREPSPVSLSPSPSIILPVQARWPLPSQR